MRTIVVAISDKHAGHKLGLMNPNVQLHEETESGDLVPYTPELTAAQTYLWELYTSAIDFVMELAGKKSRVIVIDNGDQTQGNKHLDGLVSNRLADQIDIAVANLEPWCKYKQVEKMRFTFGTGVHVLGEGSSEILIAKVLSAKYPKVDISCSTHGLLSINGVTFDNAHHGPVAGSRYWLKGNSARFYLRDRVNFDINIRHQRPADIYLRAHYHEYIHEILVDTYADNEVQCHLIITPAWCMLTDHAVKVAGSPPCVSNGLVAIEIEDGRIVGIHKFVKTLDVRTKEIL